ncbi:MAG: hypothetical protein MJ168_04185 [Clostridia bacterium]|nr:hypothetical protein [Clostridia bacterium]
MDKKSYTQRVIAHIGDKRQKQNISFELADHITEKQKWYEELEYDPETAALRAEEDMGDADTAGEELAAIRSGKDKKSGLFSTLMLVLPLIGYFVAVLQGSFEPPYRFELCYLLDCPLVFFMLATMLYSFKKQRILPLLISSAVSAFTFYSENCCALFLTAGRNIGRYAFQGYDDFNGYYIDTLLADNNVPLSLFNTLRIVLPVIVAVCAALFFAIIIKNKMLINRKYDYYIGRGLRILLFVFTAIMLVSSVIQCVRLSTFEKEYMQSVKENLPKQNRSAIEAIYEFKKSENNDFSDIIREFDLKNNPYCITDVMDKSGSDSDFVLYTRVAQYINLFRGKDFMPFEKNSAESLIEFIHNGGKYIEDAPMCCELHYDGEDRIILSCYTDYYGLNFLVFDYIDGRFQLTDTQMCTDDIEAEIQYYK